MKTKKKWTPDFEYTHYVGRNKGSNVPVEIDTGTEVAVVCGFTAEPADPDVGMPAGFVMESEEWPAGYEGCSLTKEETDDVIELAGMEYEEYCRDQEGEAADHAYDNWKDEQLDTGW